MSTLENLRDAHIDVYLEGNPAPLQKELSASVLTAFKKHSKTMICCQEETDEFGTNMRRLHVFGRLTNVRPDSITVAVLDEGERVQFVQDLQEIFGGTSAIYFEGSSIMSQTDSFACSRYAALHPSIGERMVAASEP